MEREIRGVQLGTTAALLACLALMLQTSLSAHEKGHSKHWLAPREAAERRIRWRAPRIPSNGEGHCFECTASVAMESKVEGTVPGLGQKPPDLGKMARRHSDVDLAWKITEGRGAMPGWKQALTEEAIWDLVNFIRSLGR